MVAKGKYHTNRKSAVRPRVRTCVVTSFNKRQDTEIAQLRAELASSRDRCEELQRQGDVLRNEVALLAGVSVSPDQDRSASPPPPPVPPPELMPSCSQKPMPIPPEAAEKEKEALQVQPRPVSSCAAPKCLFIDTINHSVALFAPCAWAPVCSTSAIMVHGVTKGIAESWALAESMMGAFQSMGAESLFDLTRGGPTPGPVHYAAKQLIALRVAISRTPAQGMPCRTRQWVDRWILNIDMTINLWYLLRFKHTELFFEASENHALTANAALAIEQSLQKRWARLTGGGH